jgi:sarcosine oxidase subunit gamma
MSDLAKSGLASSDLAAPRGGAFDVFAAAATAASVTALPPAARFCFRGRAAAIDAAGAAFGVALPREACRAAVAGDRAALWQGPDEWLLLAPVPAGEAIRRAFAESVAPLSHSLVDVSHRNCALEIAGPKAGDVLNTGCPLDLTPGAFGVGTCTRTLLGKAEIVLWRIAPDRFHLETWRSFGAYVWKYLEEARRGV